MRQRPRRLPQPAILIDRLKAWMGADHSDAPLVTASRGQVYVDEYAMACIATMGVCPWAPYIDMMRDDSLPSSDDHSALSAGRVGDRMATS